MPERAEGLTMKGLRSAEITHGAPVRLTGALPRRAIRLGGQDFALTEAELLALRSRVTEAILELEAERNG